MSVSRFDDAVFIRADVSTLAGQVRASHTGMAVLIERRDGPRYVEAIRGARAMRHAAYPQTWRQDDVAYADELRHGIPVRRELDLAVRMGHLCHTATARRSICPHFPGGAR